MKIRQGIKAKAIHKDLQNLLQKSKRISIVGNNDSGKTLLCRAFGVEARKTMDVILYSINGESPTEDICDFIVTNTKQMKDLLNVPDREALIILDNLDQCSEEELIEISKETSAKVIFSCTPSDSGYIKDFDASITLTGNSVVLPEACVPLEQLIREYGMVEQ